MTILSEEKDIYSEIQKKLFYIIPEKWESIYLYASVIEEPQRRSTGEMYFYYFPKGIIKKKAVNGYEIPGGFNIDEDVYSKLITDLYDVIKKLRQVWFQKTQKKWTNITISIENFQFKVEYDYQNLKASQFDSYERHVIWRYLYLKLDLELFDKKEKQIIKKYMNFMVNHTLPKRDLYMEGIYKQPVKNIVDYEKTLSVEEAIARSEKSEDVPKEKKKHHFLKKKPVIEDIIEMEDDEEFVNNQILNWKKK